MKQYHVARHSITDNIILIIIVHKMHVIKVKSFLCTP